MLYIKKKYQHSRICKCIDIAVLCIGNELITVHTVPFFIVIPLATDYLFLVMFYVGDFGKSFKQNCLTNIEPVAKGILLPA